MPRSPAVSRRIRFEFVLVTGTRRRFRTLRYVTAHAVAWRAHYKILRMSAARQYSITRDAVLCEKRWCRERAINAVAACDLRCSREQTVGGSLLQAREEVRREDVLRRTGGERRRDEVRHRFRARLENPAARRMRRKCFAAKKIDTRYAGSGSWRREEKDIGKEERRFR